MVDAIFTPPAQLRKMGDGRTITFVTSCCFFWIFGFDWLNLHGLMRTFFNA